MQLAYDTESKRFSIVYARFYRFRSEIFLKRSGVDVLSSYGLNLSDSFAFSDEHPRPSSDNEVFLIL